MAWQVQEAKQRFSELLRRAEEEGPQVVTRHGEEVAVVISADEFRKLKAPTPDFRAFLLDPDGPDFGVLELERSTEPPRQVDL